MNPQLPRISDESESELSSALRDVARAVQGLERAVIEFNADLTAASAKFDAQAEEIARAIKRGIAHWRRHLTMEDPNP